MTDRSALLIRGMPGSPYTRKMVALLRYRRIPYRLILGGHGAHRGLPAAKVELLPTVYFEGRGGELEAMVDSTPILRRLEDEWSDRHVVPADPVVAFVDELLEDFADEWLTKAMFHYRWRYAADIDKAGEVLPRWSDTAAAEETMRARKRFICDRQIGRLYVVGSNDTTAPIIEASYVRTLGLLREHLEEHHFLLGERPGSADFATYGQLTQLVGFDPTPAAVALAEAPRVVAWVNVVEDLSGLEVEDDGWLGRDELVALRPLLAEVGRGYAPVMLANAAALQSGRDAVDATVDGAPWRQQPFPYQARCLQWLRAAYARLDAEDRVDVDALLRGTGVETLFAAAAR
jgi:glutathione S-transferase